MPVRLSAALGVLAVAGCLVLIVLLHAWAGLDPVWMALSEYALGPLGWMFDTGVTCLATGSVLVLAALVRARLLRWPSVGAAALLVWAAALLVLVLFQKADWSVGPSLSGYVHRYAGFTAFVALPAAALAVGRGRPDRVAAGLCGLAVLAYGWLTVIVAGMLLYPLAGVPMWQVVPLGMVERALSLTEVAALTPLATTAYRAAPSAVDVRAGRGGTTGRRGRGSVLGEVAFRDVPAAGAADGAQHPAVVCDQ